MAYEHILYDVDDQILTVTLNRPDKLNAFTTTMLNEMIDAFDRADANDSIRAIIVTGAGRAFCAGADLSRGAETFDFDKRADRRDDGGRDGGGLLTLRIFESKKPVIAAVNGPAVGIGATMILAMDVRLASTAARFGFVFSRRGVVPEACSSWFLPRVVGISQALEWVYSGRVFPAEEALNGGLVKALYEPDALLPATREIGLEIAGNTSAISVALSRQMLWRMLGADHPMEAHKIDSRGIRSLGQGADAYEGVQSFLEKRPPKFSMRPSADMPDFFPWWTERKFE
jgi:enoyl-CoA hydratase/carnithine racemase